MVVSYKSTMTNPKPSYTITHRVQASPESMVRTSNGKPTPWTDVAVEWLKGNWLTLGASKTMLAKLHELTGATFTRNAVIGKAHREGLAKKSTSGRPAADMPPPKTPRKPRGTKVRSHNANGADGAMIKRINKVKASPPTAPELPPIIDDPVMPSNAVSMMQRDDHQCAWPVGERPDEHGKLQMMCCGGKVYERRKSYCAHHTRMGIDPARNAKARVGWK